MRKKYQLVLKTLFFFNFTSRLISFVFSAVWLCICSVTER